MEKETQTGVILVSLVALLLSVISPIIVGIKWENRKAICNQQANYTPTLSESTYSSYYWDDYLEEETVETLKEKLDFTREMNANTNKQVNKLEQILSCYFD